jgi:hypothetical protein
MVKTCDWFDSRWYRGQSAGARVFPDPVIHYALFGWKKNLNPSPRFDTEFYWNSYRDVRQLGANPLVHFLLHGHEEGRLATTTGKAVRLAHTPEHTPLPLFIAPSANQQRLTVIVDDNTPRVTGLGYLPVMALAAAVTYRRGWMLRVVIRSTRITRADIQAAIPTSAPTPHIDVVLREPGPTADVETVSGEYFWATSQTSYWSVKDFVPSSHLHWVISANETLRHPVGDLRLLTTTLVNDPAVRSVVLDASLTSSLGLAGPHTVIDALPAFLPITPTPTTPPTIGVVVDEGSPDNLFGASLKLIEEALATSVITPSSHRVALLGSITRPVTLTGSVVPDLHQPTTPAQWAEAVSSCSVLVSLGAGSEPSYLAHQAGAAGITTVTTDSGTAISDGIVDSLATALSGKAQKVPRPSVEAVVSSLDGLWGGEG